MAAGLLITRMFLVFLWSELDDSSAFPSARSYQHPEARLGARKQQEGYRFRNRHPLHYIQGLRQLHGNLQPRLNDHVQMRTWQKPQISAKVRSHVQLQNPSSPYHQAQRPYQPWSDVATKWTEGMARSYHPLLRPRGFEFNLKVPFADFLGQNRETSSTAKGSEFNTGESGRPAHYSQLFRPISVQFHSKLNSASGPDSFSDSTDHPSGEQTAPEGSEPSFQLSLSVPIASTTPSPKPSTSNDGHDETLQRPGSVGFDQNSYMEQAKPQSSSTQSGSESTFFNSGNMVRQQMEHQTYEPTQTIHTDSTQMTFSPGHVSQPTVHTEEVSQGNIPDQQSLDIPEHSATLPPVPEYSLVQSDNVHAFCYEYWKSQSGQMASPDPTNVHLSSSPSKYISIPSGHYSAGQVNGNNYGQHLTRRPVTPVSYASNYDHFKPSFGQNLPHLKPEYPQSPTVAPSQYERPSFHQYDATNYYGTGNVAQMEQTDVSYSYQQGTDESAQDVMPDHLTVFGSSANVPGLPNDYQTQMREPGQYTGRGQLNRNHEYSRLFSDVVDEDGKYIEAPAAHYDGYSGT